MKYYQLEYSTGKDIGETYPQAQEAKMDVSVDAPNHLWKVSGKLPEDVYIPTPILAPKAKPTDLISTVVLSRVIVISDKLKSIFQKFARAGVQYFPIQVINQGKPVPYWAMNIYQFKDEYI